jgi:hypothetical protein
MQKRMLCLTDRNFATSKEWPPFPQHHRPATEGRLDTASIDNCRRRLSLASETCAGRMQVSEMFMPGQSKAASISKMFRAWSFSHAVLFENRL